MSDPLIGVTCDVRVPRGHPEAYELVLDHRYATAVKNAGGFPVLLPIARRPEVISSYLDRVDGVVIVGGDDVDPKLYGEEPRRGTGAVFGPRQRFERKIYEEARARRLPVFGICYGMQLINVLEGGALFQDIRREAKLKKTRQPAIHGGRSSQSHRVRVKPNSRLAYILGCRSTTVVSEHHQAISRLGVGFRSVADAPDGIVEAIECDDESILAVQWHPERTPRSAATKKLFAWFVDLCCRHRPPGRS
jgi:putative glutamine amidotransferase